MPAPKTLEQALPQSASTPKVDPVSPPATPPRDLTKPQIPQPPSLEDDADHQIKLMISRRNKPKVEEPKPGETTSPAVTPEAPVVPRLGALLAKTLKFREPKPEAAKSEAEKPEPESEKPAAEVEPEKPKKTVVKSRPASAPVNAVKIAADAAAAATRDVLKTITDRREKHEPGPDPARDLRPDDAYEYEVAKFMAESDPRFKGADKSFLDSVRQSEKYAARWETQNPGKTFNPEDEEHEEFFSSVQRPYQPHELEQAKMEMVAQRVAEKRFSKREAELQKTIDNLKKDSVQKDLAPKITGIMRSAAGVIAKAVDEEAFKTLSTGGFGKLKEEDPIMADVITAAINELSPTIEALVQLDDPKSPIEYDENNPTHVEIFKFLAEKEQEYEGSVIDGRTCVTREDYRNMTPSQRSRSFFLTTDNLIAELVAIGAERVGKQVEAGKAHLEKLAARLGYVKQPSSNGAGESAQVTSKPNTLPSDPPKPAVEKPVSPAAVSGAKVGDKATTPKGGYEETFDKAVNILFGRG